MALLADCTAELLDRRVVKLVERVKVSDLLVIVESGRGSLLELGGPQENMSFFK